MDVEQVLHMKGGEGESSYARNSLPQRSVILKTKPMIEAAALELFSGNVALPKCIRIADLGCSSGPNSLLPTALILDAMHEHAGAGSGEFQVFLNDLPGNDFNTIFSALPSFYERLREVKGEGFGPCFVSATPGSFYGRLFPKESLHFVYCVNSLHWLSLVPSRLEDELGYLNKGEIAVGKTSRPSTFEAYSKQFKKDFTSFLESRSQELVPGGRAVLTMIGRRSRDPFAESNYSVILDDMSSAVREMIASGDVEDDKLVSFNLPYYEPHVDELKEIIQAEGSFDIVHLEEVHNATKLESDERCRTIDCKVVANGFRAVLEPVLASHFGETAMDELFDRFEEKLSRREVHMIMTLFASLVRKS